jgi:hypothetical protein
LYAGLALLAAAIATTVWGLRRRLWWLVLRRSAVTPGELVAAGRTTGRQRPVIGLAGAASLSSTVNDEPCVWHRHTVVHRQVRHSTDSRGRARRSSRRQRVGDVASAEQFTLTDGAASVAVLPERMRVHRPQRRATRVLPGVASQPFPEAAELFSGGPVRNAYHHREWVIAPGTALIVLGEVTTRGGQVVIRRPARGWHLISTAGRGRLVWQAGLQMVAVFALAAACLAASVALIVAALV